MRLPVLRAFRAWCAHPTHGVNAQLAGVPRDGTDPVPDGFALIADATTNAFAARRQVPDGAGQLPALLLGLGQSARLDPHGSQGKRDGVVEISCWYLDRDRKSAEALRDAEYRVVALERTIEAWFRQGSEADRTLLGTAAHYIERGLDVVQPFAPIGDDLIGGEMQIYFKVRDFAP
jgi:hypothetical protein